MSKILKNRITGVLMIVITLTSKAQQQGIFNTYSYDLMQINVAAMGKTCFEANLNYRSQWIKVNGAPKLYQLDANLSLGEKQAVGIKVYQNSVGLSAFNVVTGAYAYKLKLNETTKLHFGIGVSYMQTLFKAQNAVVNHSSDALLRNDGNTLRSNNFDCEAGMMLSNKKLTVGISVNHLYNTNNNESNATIKQVQDFNLHLSYLFKAGSNFEVTPWLLTRYTLNSTVNPEVLINTRFKKTITLGVGYRYSNSLVTNLGVELGVIKAVYSFDYGLSEITTHFGTSHQIMLGFDLCKKKNEKTPESTDKL